METKHPYPSDPIRIIHTKGNQSDIGSQHADQLGDSVSQGMVRFYFDFWKRMTSSKNRSGSQKWFLKAGEHFVDRVLIEKLKKQIPEFAAQRIRAMATAAKRPESELLYSLLLPDLLPILGNVAAKMVPWRFNEVQFPTFGCSSFVSRGEKFLHGRNLDFPGVGYWDRFPVVQKIAVTDKIPYVAITSSGVPFGGITGINEEQISVSLHQQFSTAFSLKGELPFIVGERILMEAKNLKDALGILERSKMNVGWGFIVADGKTRESFIYEYHPKATGVRWLSDEQSVLAHSNYYQTPECQKLEYAATSRMNWDMFARKSQLHQCVLKRGHSLNIEQSIAAISDHVDPYWGIEKVCNRIVSQAYNIQSCVYDLESMKVYIAAGDPPIHLRDFHEIDLGNLFADKKSLTGTTFPAFRFSEDGLTQAKEEFIFSFVESLDGKETAALTHLELSLSHAFTPEVATIYGVLLLKKGETEKSIEQLEKSKHWIEEMKQKKGCVQYPPEYFETLLFLARAQDIAGKNLQADKLRKFIAQHSDVEDRNLIRIAQKEKGYSFEQMKKIIAPYSTYVPFS